MPIAGRMAGRLAEELARQRDRVFLWTPVMLALGTGLYFSLGFELPLILGGCVFALALALGVLAYPLREERFGLWFAALFFMLAAAGFFTAQLRAAEVYTPMLAKKLGPVDVTGTVMAIEKLEGGSRIILYELEIEKLEPEQTPRKVRLRLRADEGIAPGQRIRALAELNPPSPPVAPGAFDFQRYSYFMGIGAVGFIYKAPEVLAEAVQRTTLELFFEQLRVGLGEIVRRDVGPREAGMAEALITGKRLGISEADSEAMRDSGLAHLISISGLHIGLVAGILFFFSRLLMVCIPGFGLRHPVKKYSAVIAFAGALFYTLLCGAPIPTVRAMLMTGIVLLAVILDRWAISMRLVVFAALVVLVTTPESLLSASFQMSFGAVAALVAFYERFRPVISRLYRDAGFVRKIALYFLGVCATTLVAGTATEPFALYHFQQYALYGLLANFVAVPLTGFVIMPAAIVALLLAPLGLSGIPFYVMERGIAGMLWTAHSVAGLKGAVFYVPAWPLAALLLIVFAALFVMFWNGRLKWAVAGALTLASILVILTHKQPDIMISSSYDLISFRTAEGQLSVSSRAKDRFTLESWERLAGQADVKAPRWHREGARDGLSCDEAGCRVELKGKKVAFAFDAYNLKEECAWADIVITPKPARGCGAALVIDRFDAWAHGAHAVWIKENGDVIVKDVAAQRGERPWTVSSKR